MTGAITTIVRDFDTDLLASIRAGAGEDKLITLGFVATQHLKQLLQDQTEPGDIYAAVIEVGVKVNMARKAIKHGH